MGRAQSDRRWLSGDFQRPSDVVGPIVFGRPKPAPELWIAYLDPNFIAHIPKREVRTIFELGSRHALDAIRLRRFYGARVHAFECDPEAIAICEKNLEKEKHITLVPKAVWNRDGAIPFFPIDATRSRAAHGGASSCFLLNFKERSRPEWREEVYVQKRIKVDAIRIDTYCRERGIRQIDLVCMDLEGAELQALEGFGDMLDSVKYIITEVRAQPMHYGETVLFGGLEDFLKKKGFTCRFKMLGDLFGDALFVREAV